MIVARSSPGPPRRKRAVRLGPQPSWGRPIRAGASPIKLQLPTCDSQLQALRRHHDTSFGLRQVVRHALFVSCPSAFERPAAGEAPETQAQIYSPPYSKALTSNTRTRRARVSGPIVSTISGSRRLRTSSFHSVHNCGRARKGSAAAGCTTASACKRSSSVAWIAYLLVGNNRTLTCKEPSRRERSRQSCVAAVIACDARELTQKPKRNLSRSIPR